MNKSIDNWKQKKEAVRKAKEWNNLPNGPKYQRGAFLISISHCSTPMLSRMGQQTCGGKSYWETGEEFNKAILKYLINHWGNIYPKVIEAMEKEEKEALLKCQSYIDEMQKVIDSAGK